MTLTKITLLTSAVIITAAGANIVRVNLAAARAAATHGVDSATARAAKSSAFGTLRQGILCIAAGITVACVGLTLQ